MLKKALKWGNSQTWSKHAWTSGVSRRFNLIQERATKKQDDQFKNEMNFMANKPNYTLRDYKQKVSSYKPTRHSKSNTVK